MDTEQKTGVDLLERAAEVPVPPGDHHQPQPGAMDQSISEDIRKLAAEKLVANTKQLQEEAKDGKGASLL